MNARWQQLAIRYAALSRREQLLIAVATIALVGFLLYSLWVGPAAQRAAGLRKQMEGQQADLATLRAQVASLKSQLHDPDAANRKVMAELQARLSDIDSQIGRLDEKLVPPQRMGKLLQTVLARQRGLSLVSLRSLPPEPLIMPPVEKGSAARAPAVPRENIYRHGLEIRIAGGYADLLAYVAELERAPERLLWGGMVLAVTDYPRSELTLTVYTLSRDLDWLTV
ncbi:MAG TPA: type II secretion system protein GspM [Rhodocyclaceae bacterium]|nr:type II secretion system protein GspM [Rhodocyclaceae bacterium]